MAMEDQILALVELLKGVQSRMDRNHDYLMKTLEANTSMMRCLSRSSLAPSPTSILTAETEEPEISASQISNKLALTSSASLIPSPTSAPPHDADPGFQSGVIELPYARDPLASAVGDLGFVHLDSRRSCSHNSDHHEREVPNSSSHDLGGIDRLSSLPDSLLRHIVARLPVKDAARTAVLSRHWNPIFGTSGVLQLKHLGLRFNGTEWTMPSELCHLNGYNSYKATNLRGFFLEATHMSCSEDPYVLVPQLGWSQFGVVRICSDITNDSAEHAPTSVLEFLVRPYDPGTGLIGSACAGICFDIEGAEHARAKTFAMGILCRCTCTWPADLRTGVGPTLKVDIATHIGSLEFLSAMHTKCSMMCLYQSVGDEFPITSEISASSEDLVSWCPAASTSDAYKVFKIMSVFLFLLPSSCCSVWNLHSVYNRDD